MRHSAAHVMAAAVCRLYDDVKLDIGPATASGFYYDFDLPERLTPEDFESIEEEMSKIIAEDHPFECFEISRDEARHQLSEAGQTFKIQRLADIPEDEVITFYRCGKFVDLCRGPHIDSTAGVRAFKLTSVAGSYFRGLETNPMLQRLYGIVGASDKALRIELQRLDEARKRDHRKIGKELDLFSIRDDVGPGLIHWHPRGARIRTQIENYWRDQHYANGYELVYTPHVGRSKLWDTSGHLQFYRESMYSPMDVDGEDYFVKPMNCPFHIQIYQTAKRSYRELPLRWAELGTVYRYEKSGVLHGLLRVRGFTQDDAHIFCMPEQIETEISNTLDFAMKFLRGFGFDTMKAYLATKPEKAVGDESRWQQATTSLEKALERSGIDYERDIGGGAFYGPKIDLKIKDALDREWQMGTIQFDFNLPEKFSLTYVASDGADHQPYMIHRALLGSLERFFGILIEHYAGAFPLWLSPEQVRVLPLTERQLSYGRKVLDQLRSSGFRVEMDERSEKVGAKIRRAQTEKIPFMLVVGPKEAEGETIAVRSRTGGDQGAMTVDAFIGILSEQNKPGEVGAN
jgi:threonyl-tRNA synthetase